jgi:membrane-associated phospholipid phosphatase
VRYAYASLTASFAALAVLVAAGAFTGLDQWSVDHLMPGAAFSAREPSLRDALIPLYATHWHRPYSVATNIVTVPASFVVALVLTAWRSRALAVALVAAVAVETLCKHVLDRPALHDGALHIVGFDDSFPSGHTLRAVILAGAFASPWAAAWAVAAIVLLVVAGWHTPTDVAGGVLLGLLALAAARLLGARRLRGGRLARGRAG